jgi:hypothetical protein
MSIKEILQELPKPSREECAAPRFFAETDALLAAVEEGFRSMEQGPLRSLEEARETVKRCATRSK